MAMDHFMSYSHSLTIAKKAVAKIQQEHFADTWSTPVSQALLKDGTNVVEFVTIIADLTETDVLNTGQSVWTTKVIQSIVGLDVTRCYCNTLTLTDAF